MDKDEFIGKIGSAYCSDRNALNECIQAYRDLYDKNEFLTKRDNKLQQIEQMFKNGQVDLSELSKLVKDK